MKRPALILATIVVAVAVVGAFAWRGGGDIASVEQTERLALGRTLYADNCASCHGANLEGQPNWQTPNAEGKLPAPPHDATGHTWHHGDEQLFAITKFGTAALVGNGYESDMIGFGDTLGDDGIRAVLDYIKSTWPEREAAYQRQASGS